MKTQSNEITFAQAKRMYYEQNLPFEIQEWEHPERKSGLLLAECPHCHAKQTRENYAGFWQRKITTRQGYSCVGIAQCRCGKWVKWSH